MRQWVLRILTALFALLTALAVYGWVRSYPAERVPSPLTVVVPRLPNGDRACTAVVSDVGVLSFQTTILTPADEKQGRRHGMIMMPLAWRWQTLGFAYVRTPDSYPRRFFLVGLPYWFLTLLCAAPPAWRAVRWWRRRRIGPYACPRCGYDLRGSPGACPECGFEGGKAGEAGNGHA